MPSQPDPWQYLRQLTHARIGLGRCGASVPTQELLRFNLAHAEARDAVWQEADFDRLTSQLSEHFSQILRVESRCDSKQTFLLNPAMGKSLSPRSVELLQRHREAPHSAPHSTPYDTILVIADGLSALGINSLAHGFTENFASECEKQSLTLGPIILARYARVALGDHIGSLLNSRSIVMLIGERPGLANAKSLSVYCTYAPSMGKSDADRNCLSNIQTEGLEPKLGAFRAAFLLKAAIQRQISGVNLKVEYPAMVKLSAERDSL